MNEDQQFCLRWNNFQSNVLNAFEELKKEEDFVDVTISCEGKQLRAHKMILSACSSYFKEILKDNPCTHPIIIMNNVPFSYMEKLLTFIYSGQVNVTQKQLTSFLLTAETLKIKGLADPNSNDANESKLESKPCKVLQPNRVLQNESLSQHSDNLDASPSKSSNSECFSEESSTEISAKRFKSGILDYRESSFLVKPKIEVEDEQDLVEEDKYVPESANEEFEEYSKIDHQSHLKSELSGTVSKGSQEMLPISDAIESPFNIRPHSLDPQPCPICHRMYSNLSNLRQHMRIIHAPRMCVCPLCLKPFKTELYLRRHLVSYHDISKSHVSSYSNAPSNDGGCSANVVAVPNQPTPAETKDATETVNKQSDTARFSGGSLPVIDSSCTMTEMNSEFQYDLSWMKHSQTTFDNIVRSQSENGS